MYACTALHMPHSCSNQRSTVHHPSRRFPCPATHTHIRTASTLQEAARRALQAQIAEEKRRAVHEAAERQREAVREKLEAKLARVKPRFVSEQHT